MSLPPDLPEVSASALRVLHLIPTFAGGGAERQLGYLGGALPRQGLDVHVGYLREGPNLKLLENTGVTLHRLAAAGSHDLRLPWMIQGLLRRLRPHVLQTWLPQMDVLGGLAARLGGVPWILSERSASSAYLSGWKIRARKILGKGATAIAANSAIGLDYWRDAPARVRRRTIRNIVPLDAIAASTFTEQEISGLGLCGARLVVGAGRLQAEKNWEVFIAAMNTALPKLPDVHAVIFGDGAQREDLKRQVDASPCADRIHLKPYTDDLWKWFKLASCYVSVSQFEGSPNVLLEALACRLPAVVSDIPAHREILSGSAAQFVPSNSADAVADSVVRILGDANAMARRAHDSFQVIRHWSADSIAAEYAALYREISRRDS